MRSGSSWRGKKDVYLSKKQLYLVKTHILQFHPLLTTLLQLVLRSLSDFFVASSFLLNGGQLSPGILQGHRSLGFNVCGRNRK